MAKALQFIAINQDGVIDTHAVGANSNYATLCGMDGNNSKAGQSPAPTAKNSQITCPYCKSIIIAARRYWPLRDFSDG